ncbi:hypothetical protein Cgig2_034140 [Carnegiea gigantea]|uniref:ABC transmembrane type-1 domain-containing protein n=1 Tax=Carnegiea gigantea TaxID=171969 RepID=A0A9Q1KD04_9CARY|nr:hypothetical protein Cgig2_034140 [Carnegiea gigantea]
MFMDRHVLLLVDFGYGDVVHDYSGVAFWMQTGERQTGRLRLKLAIVCATFLNSLWGFLLGFLSTWKLTLVTLAVFPLLAATGLSYTLTMSTLSKKAEVFYAESGKIAEEPRQPSFNRRQPPEVATSGRQPPDPPLPPTIHRSPRNPGTPIRKPTKSPILEP